MTINNIKLHEKCHLFSLKKNKCCLVAMNRGLLSVLCRIKMLPVVGHVHGLRETLRVCAATANVALTLMKYTHSYII